MAWRVLSISCSLGRRKSKKRYFSRRFSCAVLSGLLSSKGGVSASLRMVICSPSNLNLSRLHFRIYSFLKSSGHVSFHLNDVFAADGVGNLPSVMGSCRVESHLCETVAIAKVYKNHTAVIASGVDPSSECNRFSDVVFADFRRTYVFGT